MRNVLVKVPRNHQPMVAAMVRTIFAQPDAVHVERQVKEMAATMKRQFPLVTEILLDAGEDVTAFRHFPVSHWQKIWSTNSFERLNAEIKRRTNVVGIFPNDAAALRLSPRSASRPTSSGASLSVATSPRSRWIN